MNNFSVIISKARRLMKGDELGKSLKGKELGRGITQRKDGLYQGSFMINGIRRTVYGGDIATVKQKMKAAKDIPTPKKRAPTLDAWFEEWLSTYKKNLRDTTVVSYRTAYKRIGRVLGSIPIDILDLPTLQRAFNTLPSDVARKTSRMVISECLKTAVKIELIPKNVAADVNIYVSCDTDKEERRVLSKEETIWLKDAVSSYRHRDVIFLGLETGMRINEILGLTAECLDFTKGVIRVKQALTKVGGEYRITRPKSTSGKRSVPMTSAARDILTKYKDSDGLLFRTSFGTPVNYRMVDGDLKRFSRIIAASHDGFRDVTPHTLRHTFATRCIEKGMNPKTLQKILGHATIGMTMDLYCHVSEDTVVEEMKRIDSL